MQNISGKNAFGKIRIKTLYNATHPKNTRKLKKSVLIKKLLKLKKLKIESILRIRLVRRLFQNE